MKEGINVLSLFDGMSCGMIALERAGIKVNKYYASEIDKYAIKVSQANYTDIVQIGSVVDVKVSDLPKIDLLIGGSPCQGFSFAGKQLNFEDPRSKLFFEYVRILNEIKECNPSVKFLLENVNMKKEYQDIISDHLGVEPIFINSSLVSAQNRQRLYWTNIKGVTIPDDRGVLLESVLEKGVSDRDKSYCIDANYWKGTTLEQYLTKSRRQIVFTERRTEEAKKIRSEFMKLYKKDFSPRRSKELVPRGDHKCNCLTTSLTKEHILLDEQNSFRKLTPIECERLQTVPDNYTNYVSDSQRYKMLGNGWTVDVIAHIFKELNSYYTS